MWKLLTACAASVAMAEDHVVVGTADNFKDVIKENPDGVLAEFYAPWCGHCKKIEPEYVKAAAKLHALHEDGTIKGKIKLVKIDATVESTLASEFGVNGYPTLKWFTGDAASPNDYDGPREADGIVSWIQTMTGPAVTTGEPTGEEKFSVTFRGKDMAEFEKVAKANRKSANWFYVKADKDSMDIQHKGEDKVSVDDAADSEAMEKAFKANRFPKFGALDGDSFAQYMESAKGVVWVLMDMKSGSGSKDEQKESVVNAVRKDMVAMADELAKLDNPYTVTWTDTVEFEKVLESMFGVKDFPKIVVQKKIGDKKHFLMEVKDIVKDDIIAFVKKVEAGEITATLKSEEPSEDYMTQPDSPVKVVVGKTLEEQVFQKEADVMLEVYAPWCGHCKKIEPEYLKVAKKIVKEGFEDILVLAKMDGTTNDSPVDSISWTGFPTMVYVKAGTTEVIKYDGGRDAKGIWKWIKKNHSKADVIKDKLAKKKTDSKDEAEPKKEDKKEEL